MTTRAARRADRPRTSQGTPRRRQGSSRAAGPMGRAPVGKAAPPILSRATHAPAGYTAAPRVRAGLSTWPWQGRTPSGLHPRQKGLRYVAHLTQDPTAGPQPTRRRTCVRSCPSAGTLGCHPQPLRPASRHRPHRRHQEGGPLGPTPHHLPRLQTAGHCRLHRTTPSRWPCQPASRLDRRK